MEPPIRAIGRELLSRNGESVTQTDFCLATGLLPWKISRLLKRLEILGLVEVEREPRFTRGRPKKLYKLSASGTDHFTGLVWDGDNTATSMVGEMGG